MADRREKKWRRWSVVGLVLALSLSCSILTRSTCFGIDSSRESPPQAEAEAEFALMAEAWNTIKRAYVDRSTLKSRHITHGAISGMVDALGDSGHSTFLTKEMIREEQEFVEGRYQGVGIDLRMEDGHALIVAPLDGSPAQKAGLRPGEIITKVDDKSLIGLDLIRIVKLILGVPGTRVRLVVLDPASSATREVALTRTFVELNNVRWQLLPGTTIAHLRIAGFSSGVSGALRRALRQIRKGKITGLVLDLRDDPGGLLDEATLCASHFLTHGNVLLEKNAAGEITPVPVLPEPEATQLPLVVLVNEGTVSAAEIVAGAIKDAGRGKLVGRKTFGAGTVLEQFDLSDGSALMLAVEEWLTPKGQSIWHKGVAPDFEVALPERVRPLFPQDEAGMTPSGLRSSRDRQLLKALELLSGGSDGDASPRQELLNGATQPVLPSH